MGVVVWRKRFCGRVCLVAVKHTLDNSLLCCTSSESFFGAQHSTPSTPSTQSTLSCGTLRPPSEPLRKSGGIFSHAPSATCGARGQVLRRAARRVNGFEKFCDMTRKLKGWQASYCCATSMIHGCFMEGTVATDGATIPHGDEAHWCLRASGRAA